ncbi:hypothetical protein PV343_03275 [Streptomyces sp. WI03-4A]|uniref:FtsX-like permease family protein n=1 Tax=Streptomyces sp. WI03-4A TaxID=3028706 RepID=UPI0029BF4638|nr:hypothetical protein [Streptomyces sp. WI03-4A]MDX2591328.1 hypothetical protein [Streptomyces sp. WI03-4A]
MRRRKAAPARLTNASLRIGRSAARGTESGRLRLVALCAATFAVAVSLAAFVVVAATYEGRDSVQAARSPQVVPPSHKAEAIARWQESFDTIGGEQYSVIYVEPLTGNATPPPGLRSWPAPGHSAISYGALAAGADEEIASRYGSMDVPFEADGLASIAERLIYVRPSGHLEEGMYVKGWGGDSAGMPFGEPASVQPATGFYVLIAATWLTPALCLTVIAARTGSAARDRRQAVLHALGVGRRHRLLIDLGEAGPPVLVGSALAILTLWIYQGTNWPLPGVNFVMTARYVQSHGASLYLCALAAAIAVTAVAMTVQPRVSASPHIRPIARDRRSLLRTAAWLCPLALGLAFYGPSLLGFDDNEFLFLIPYTVGALLALCSLPAALALLTAHCGRGLASWGRRYSSASALLAGRWLATKPAALARVIVSIVMVMGVSAQLYTWNNRVSPSETGARQVQHQLSDTVMKVEGIDRNSSQRLDSFLKALPDGLAALAVYEPSAPVAGQPTMRISGSRAALQQAGLPLPKAHQQVSVTTANTTSPRGSALASDTTSGRPTDVVTTVGTVTNPDGLAYLYLVAQPGTKVSGPDIKRTANARLLPGWTADPPGTEWTSGLAVYQEQGWWLPLFALGTVALLAFTTCLASMAEFLRFGRSMAPVVVIAGSRRVFVRTTLLVFLGGFTIAVAAGAGAALLLTLPMLKPPINAQGVPPALAGTAIAIVMATACVITSWSVWITLRETGRWRPAGE